MPRVKSVSRDTLVFYENSDVEICYNALFIYYFPKRCTKDQGTWTIILCFISIYRLQDLAREEKKDTCLEENCT